MKRALKLIYKYIFYIVIGSIAGTLFYLLYTHLLQYVPEGEKVGFSFGDLLRVFFKVLSYSIYIVTPTVICHKLKRSGTVLQCLAYILLSILAWGMLQPFSYKMYKKFEVKYPVHSQFNPLSKNQFRQLDNMIYFFADDFNPDSDLPAEISAVVIDTSEEGYVSVEKIRESNDFNLITSAGPYRDILVKDSFSIKNGIISFDSFLVRMNDSLNKGFTFFLGTLSLAFVLCAIYGLANISSWRLVNSGLVISMTIFVMFFNTAYFNSTGIFLRNSSIAKLSIFDGLGKFVDEPFLCILNFVVGFIFIVIGIIRFIILKNKSKNTAKGE